MIDRKLLDALHTYLTDVVAEEKHFSIEEIRGLFYAQMITPGKINALPWVSALFYGAQPNLTQQQITTLNTHITAVQTAYHDLLVANQLVFPFDFEQLDEDLAELAYSWCLGFYTGLAINDIFWFGKKGEQLKGHEKEREAVRNSAHLFYGLATKDFSGFDKQKIKEVKAILMEQGQEPSNDLIAIALFPNVPIAVKSLQTYGILTMHAAQVTKPVTTEKKLGRNEPCFCGSGKKYKKCCG